MKNPIVDGGGQPFRLDQLVILERRTEDGRLDLRSQPQPPVRAMKFDDLYKMFFREDKTAPGSWDALRAWLESKGWVVRACTWRV